MARKSKESTLGIVPQDDIENEVGYCRPPKQHQFQPGVSGNPKGRPKGSKKPRDILIAVLKEKIHVQEGGRRLQMTKLEAAIRQALSNCFKGDVKGLQIIAALYKLVQDQPSESPQSAELSVAESEIIADFLRRQDGVELPNRSGAS